LGGCLLFLAGIKRSFQRQINHEYYKFVAKKPVIEVRLQFSASRIPERRIA
jgi:hypothetical protein